MNLSRVEKVSLCIFYDIRILAQELLKVKNRVPALFPESRATLPPPNSFLLRHLQQSAHSLYKYLPWFLSRSARLFPPLSPGLQTQAHHEPAMS